MPVVDTNVLYALLVSLFLVSLFLSFKFFAAKKEKLLLKKLEDELSAVKAENEQLKKRDVIQKQKESYSQTTSFVSEQLEKIKKLEEELEKQKQRVQEAKLVAQDAMMVKYEFLSNIRHEIRTPMNSILAFSDLLVHEIKDRTLLTYANNIFASGHKLLHYLDDIIELSRLESGTFEIKESAVDIHTLFEDVVQNYMFDAYKKGLDLSLHLDTNLPKSLIIDDQKVSDILSNFIDNAMKFTKSGSIKVEIFTENFNSVKNSVDLLVRVTDTGMGIDEKDHEKIFEIFEKREECNELEFQGTGLGLSINKKMANAMNGDISLVSKKGEGSAFTLRLSAVEVVLMSAEDGVDESSLNFSLIKPDGANVMVIDADKESHKIIGEAFSTSAVSVVGFDSPRDAIGKLQQKNFNIIFIDIHMLSNDDNALYKVITKMSRAFVVSLTDESVKDIHFPANSSRLVGHLKKPVSKLELFKISMKILNNDHDFHAMNEKNNFLGNEFNDVSKESLEGFLKESKGELQELYKIALSTNDLNAIQKFGDELLRLAKNYSVSSFVTYAEQLLEYIELFDIDSITRMMQEYKAMMKRVQNL